MSILPNYLKGVPCLWNQLLIYGLENFKKNLMTSVQKFQFSRNKRKIWIFIQNCSGSSTQEVENYSATCNGRYWKCLYAEDHLQVKKILQVNAWRIFFFFLFFAKYNIQYQFYQNNNKNIENNNVKMFGNCNNRVSLKTHKIYNWPQSAISTSALSRPLWEPRLSIILTTFKPSTTRPNTTCFPSSLKFCRHLITDIQQHRQFHTASPSNLIDLHDDKDNN